MSRPHRLTVPPLTDPLSWAGFCQLPDFILVTIRRAMRELNGARRLVRRFERGHRALILLYHRIASPTTDPWTLAVSPDRFADHLAVLRDHRFSPLRLGELVTRLERGAVPERAIVVTFDDGYADNLHAGVPLLERYGVPATFYLTSGFLDARHEFWWKQLEQLLLEPNHLPQRLTIAHPALRWSWDLGEDARYPPERAALHRKWTVNDRSSMPLGPRQGAFLSLLGELSPVSPAARDQILVELFRTAGVSRATRPSHRMLSPQEVCRLAEAPCADIGAHTVSHPHLSTLSPSAQEDEIRRSKAQLERIIDRRVDTFAYPFGEAADFDATTLGLVRGAGYTSAGAVRDLAVSRSSPLFALPRVGIDDWDGEEFERHLEWWLRRGL